MNIFYRWPIRVLTRLHLQQKTKSTSHNQIHLVDKVEVLHKDQQRAVCLTVQCLIVELALDQLGKELISHLYNRLMVLNNNQPRVAQEMHSRENSQLLRKHSQDQLDISIMKMLNQELQKSLELQAMISRPNLQCHLFQLTKAELALDS